MPSRDDSCWLHLPVAGWLACAPRAGTARSVKAKAESESVRPAYLDRRCLGACLVGFADGAPGMQGLSVRRGVSSFRQTMGLSARWPCAQLRVPGVGRRAHTLQSSLFHPTGVSKGRPRLSARPPEFLFRPGRGPAVSGVCLRNTTDLSQTRTRVPIADRPSVHGMPLMVRALGGTQAEGTQNWSDSKAANSKNHKPGGVPKSQHSAIRRASVRRAEREWSDSGLQVANLKAPGTPTELLRAWRSDSFLENERVAGAPRKGHSRSLKKTIMGVPLFTPPT